VERKCRCSREIRIVRKNDAQQSDVREMLIRYIAGIALEENNAQRC
jgi:hypothetical protein